MVLYEKKPEDELPKQVELELKILFNMHDYKFDEKQSKNKEKIDEESDLKKEVDQEKEQKHKSNKIKEK